MNKSKKVSHASQSLARKALDATYRGLTLLESLIRERRAQNLSESNDAALSQAFSGLSSLAADLRLDLIRYAEAGMPWACQTIFREAKALASAFSRLAIACPERFRPCAEHSLTMPSLRARNSSFTCDAEAIIAAVHLAEKAHANNLHDNRTRLGALCHQFMAEIVDLLVACRLEAQDKGDTDSKWVKLPDLAGNAKAWWKAEVKEWVQREYERMKNNPRRNAALWQELERVTDHGTDAAKRAALEKYCFNKLEQIAGAPGPS